jgi:putative two-component system response regulator
MTFFEAMDRRDAHTGEHAQAVARLSGLVGLKIGLTTREMRTLLVSALLHDLGKIFVPDPILKKPGPLTPEERLIMEMHPVAGSRILARSEVPPAAVAVARHHHERYDGGGYPDGLRGEGIPLAARLVQVADAFDSMTRGRIYRWGIPPTEALEEIKCNAGTQFDPRVVQAFVAATANLQRLSLSLALQ